ncbi:hypothetical protein LL946_06990 [Knoellia locipacati]|uniref:hypothetical protein n=1 Tax=Knoellia locipacati TaxID=882824 RepID=UPI00384EA119
MSQTPDQPGSPESPANPPTMPIEPTAPPAPPASQPAMSQAAPGTTARRSMWGEATSTRGGTLAVILAGASLALVALLVAALGAVFVARHVGDDRGRGPWATDSRDMPGRERMNPERGPQQLPPGQNGGNGRGGAGDLPGLGLPGLGLPGAGAPLHGEAVVPGEGAATTTVVFQRGVVTAVTADTLTVKSTDGHTATYTIGADTRQRLQDKVSTLATGDEVTVVATKDGNVTLRILRTGRTEAGD